MPKPDMSPSAITRRWKQVDELRDLCLALAGPRLKRPWGVPKSQDDVNVVKDRKETYSTSQC